MKRSLLCAAALIVLAAPMMLATGRRSRQISQAAVNSIANPLPICQFKKPSRKVLL